MNIDLIKKEFNYDDLLIVDGIIISSAKHNEKLYWSVANHYSFNSKEKAIKKAKQINLSKKDLFHFLDSCNDLSVHCLATANWVAYVDNLFLNAVFTKQELFLGIGHKLGYSKERGITCKDLMPMFNSNYSVFSKIPADTTFEDKHEEYSFSYQPFYKDWYVQSAYPAG